MSLAFKDNRNNNLRTNPKHPHHLPLSSHLRNQQRKLAQRAGAAHQELENIKALEQEGEMKYFELVNRRISSEKALKEAQEKIVKLDKEIKYTDLVSNSVYKEHKKGEQKRKDIALRYSVHMY